MMSGRLTRRGLVKGLGLAPLVGVAMPRPMDASTPVMVEFAKYRHLRNQTDSFSGSLSEAQDKALNALFDQRFLVEDRLMALPSQTAADFAVKAIVDTERACMISDWETGALWIEARALCDWGKP